MTADIPARPAAYAALGTTFGVVSDRPDLLEWLDTLWRHARTDEPAAHVFTLVSPGEDEPHGPWTIAVDDAPSAAVPAHEVVLRLHWEINRLARAARGPAVLLHAGVVEIGGVGVVVVGPSEAGKSTLVLGLCERGAAYLSDELAPVRRVEVVVDAYPKPLALRPGSWPLVTRFHPGLPAALTPLLRDEWFVAPDQVASSTVPRLLVFASYDPAQPGAAVTAIDRSDALVRLSQQADDLAAQPPGAFTALGALARTADAYLLRSSDLDAACGVLQSLAEPLGDAS